ncbi:MAG: hypothetical protein M3Y73_19510, partial [Actinomycetota bacterium]|nr:hypothetical protein [Actinomycetota bacterium]
QTMMYLMLSVAGHLTIFLTRTRGPFWSIRPARILLLAVLGTQAVATLIAVYGLFMTPLGWGWAAFVWGYAILWALASDRVKLFAYRILDRTTNTDENADKDTDGPDANTLGIEGDPSDSSASAKAAAPPKLAAFYTDTDPGDPVYHDNDGCPFGVEIKSNHNDHPGTADRRRCTWCTQHAQPVTVDH